MSQAKTELSTSQRQAMLEAILERTAEQIGDITAPAIDLYYSRYPEAREQFVELSLGQAEAMEAEMIESALFCLMNWYEQPVEVEVLFANMVPHHEYLKIPVEYFTGLQAAVMDVVSSVIKEDEVELKALVDGLKLELTHAIERCSEQRPRAPAN